MTAIMTRGGDLGSGKVTQAGVIASEWIKLRSLRSTWFSLFAALIIIDGLGTLFSSLHEHRDNGRGAIGPGGVFQVDATQVSLRGVFLAQLAIGVLGVLFITGEYSTGQIRSSLAAVPHRVPVLIAKAGVFAALAFVVTIVATFVGFLLGQQAQASSHMQATLSTPGAVRAIIGAAIYLTLVGLMGVGLGFVIRNTAGAIATLFGIVLVAPLLANALPTPYSTDVTKYLPLTAAQRVIATSNPDPNTLGPWVGLGVTAIYAAVALILGVAMLKRRDA